MKIVICDPIAAKGITHFQGQNEFEVLVLDKRLSEDELLPIAADAVAMVVRSETKITRRVMEAAPNLRVVGRAGVGVDNVDVEAATELGVVVMNTPGGNTISTAELTFSMLMAIARKIPQAHASMKEGRWDRKAFKGTEICNKTLGILGLGRIGTEVAKRAQAFGMKVVAYDPYVTQARAKAVQVGLFESLEELYPVCDFITVHMHLTDDTRGMINSDAFAKMKKGVRILNCARGGIVDESALADAIESGQCAGAALDVYDTEPLPADDRLRSLDEVIMTPHLGASTTEAQDSCGIEIAELITDYLLHGVVRTAINMPSLDAKTFEAVKPFLTLGERLGRLLAQLAPKRNDRIVITFGGGAADIPSDPVMRYVLKGFLEHSGGKDVNLVNVLSMSNSLGIEVDEVKSYEDTDFLEWLHVAVHSGDTKVSAGGTIFGKNHQPRIVRLNGQPVEIVPEGVLFLMNNKDRPGIVGHIGTLMSRHGVNIANMTLARDCAGGQALTVLNLDSRPPDAFFEEVAKDADISNVRVATL
ncbi:MAG: phosphoglycerate dehydrogenase [Verrucomicrobiae bacterium]|nr:phosphoglycerate dehydrogenase [Verrucomicrobiae bacterium]